MRQPCLLALPRLFGERGLCQWQPVALIDQRAGEVAQSGSGSRTPKKAAGLAVKT
jgi:hypothetical protein